MERKEAARAQKEEVRGEGGLIVERWRERMGLTWGGIGLGGEIVVLFLKVRV